MGDMFDDTSQCSLWGNDLEVRESNKLGLAPNNRVVT